MEVRKNGSHSIVERALCLPIVIGTGKSCLFGKTFLPHSLSSLHHNIINSNVLQIMKKMLLTLIGVSISISSTAQESFLKAGERYLLNGDSIQAKRMFYSVIRNYPGDTIACICAYAQLNMYYSVNNQYDSIKLVADYLKLVSLSIPWTTIVCKGRKLQRFLRNAVGELVTASIRTRRYKEALQEIKIMRSIPDDPVAESSAFYPFASHDMFSYLEAAEESDAFKGLSMIDSAIHCLFKYLFYPWPIYEECRRKMRTLVQSRYTPDSWSDELKSISQSLKVIHRESACIEITLFERPLKFELKDPTVMTGARSEDELFNEVRTFLFSPEVVSLASK
jgi:hypothetical protein